ncbi:Ig domain-containing protein [Photobacterium aquimaris]|uniref:Ig domain-containing protein n=1 Tax=Photobacterium aquimaris TaxID=512643 RepID=UPI0039A1F35D
MKPDVKPNNKPEISNVIYTLNNTPPWLSINSTTGLLSGTPLENNIGISNFNIIVSDGKYSVSQPISLTITANTA